MQRLQSWLTPGIAFFTLSVGLIGLHLHLDKFAYLAMVIGSLLIICGFIVEVAYPAIKWWWRGFRSFDAALRERIKAGRKLLGESVDHEKLRDWQRNTEIVFVNFLRLSHPEVDKFEQAGKVTVQVGQFSDTPETTRLVKQISALRELRQTLRNDQDTMVIFAPLKRRT